MKKLFCCWRSVIAKIAGWGIILVLSGFVLLFMLIAVLIFFDVSFSDGNGRCDELFECKDVYEFLGDGRFYIMTIMDHKSLFDEEFNGGMGILVNLDRYLVVGDFIYIEGDYSYTSNRSAYYDIESGNIITYESLEEVSRYTILNYKTAEVEFYLTLEDVPEESRVFFEKDLGWWCKLQHTCYEEQ